MVYGIMTTRLAGIGIATEVSTPLDKRAAFELARSDRVAADGAEDTRISELRLRCDHRVGDIVINGTMFLLLYLQDGAILEGPLYNVRLLIGPFDGFTLADGGPELGEVLDGEAVSQCSISVKNWIIIPAV